VTAAEGRPLRVKGPWRRAAGRFFRQPTGLIGAVLCVAYVIAAIAAPLLAPHSPLTVFPGHELEPPSGQFLLGTDPIGRDVLSRTIYATRPALMVALASVAIGFCIGAVSGLSAGFYQDRGSNLMMRVWDGIFAVPAVIIALVLAATFGPGLAIIIVAIGLHSAPGLARVSRAATLGETGLGYVEAARALGLRDRRIFSRHAVPNALGSVIVQVTLAMSGAVLAEATISFLGAGVQPPTASWGNMLSDSRSYLGVAWWYAIAPGVAITVLVLALYMVGDAGRDALDPRTESRVAS